MGVGGERGQASESQAGAVPYSRGADSQMALGGADSSANGDQVTLRASPDSSQGVGGEEGGDQLYQVSRSLREGK